MSETSGTTEDARARAPGVAEIVSFVRALVELSKPGITRMVLFTTALGAAIAPGPVRDWTKFGYALLGTSLIVAAANALNMFLEGDVDALMKRTRERPIPSGRISPEVALWFGGALAFTGLPILDFCVNPLTAFIGGFSLLSYVLVYTPLKRLSSVAVWVGAVPGAAPPLMGYTAMTSRLDAVGLSLFALLFIWQIPHFHAIALFRTSEYTRAGLVVLPASRGVDHTKRVIVALLCLQLLVSALPAWLGLGGVPYIVSAVVLGLAYLAYGIAGFYREDHEKWARSLFFASLPYLVVLFGALVLFTK
ncbi:MAG TPA: heme o synthase [Polyangiaceae bacterium]|nr:heme o synthase [Polyangiaceae bacterium]